MAFRTLGTAFRKHAAEATPELRAQALAVLTELAELVDGQQKMVELRALAGELD